MKKRQISSLTRWSEVEKRLLMDKDFLRTTMSMEGEYELAKSLIEIRLRKNLSQTDLAKRIGSKQPVISRLENMTSKPTLTLLNKISKALNVKLRVYFQAN